MIVSHDQNNRVYGVAFQHIKKNIHMYGVSPTKCPESQCENDIVKGHCFCHLINTNNHLEYQFGSFVTK